MLIGIGGPSRAGKSTLADALGREITSRSLTYRFISQDDYVHRPPQLPMIRDHVDWEHPDSIDWKQLRRSLRRALTEVDIVLHEGLLAYANPEINQLYDRTLFLHISEPTFRTRKAADLRWGQEPEWYVDHIWDSYHHFGKPAESLPGTIHLSGEVMVTPRIIRALVDAVSHAEKGI
jgi:nicotinamide/nicotinate riboside kinase